MRASILVSAIALVAACSSPVPEARAVENISSAVRSVTNNEARADFGQIVDALRGLWGAQERKEQRYGFSFEKLASEYADKVAAADNEAEYTALYLEFLAVLRDAHIYFWPSVQPDEIDYFELPLLVMPIGDTYVVYAGPEDAPFARGDELLSIDGVSTAELVKKFSIYDGVPNDLTLAHFGASYLTGRYDFVDPELQDGTPAVLTLRKPSGEKTEVTVHWTAAPHQLPPTSIPSFDQPGQRPLALAPTGRDVISAELASLGGSVPFFLTPEVQAQYNVEPVQLSDEAIAKYNVNREVAESGKYLAFRYSYCGKTLLILRLPDYIPYDLEDASDEADVRESINYLRALLATQAPLVDGLVVDDTHNPGGDILLVHQFAALLADKPLNGLVQKMNADRFWIGAYLELAQEIRATSDEDDPALALEYEGYAHQIDLAYSNGQPLSEPLPIPLPFPVVGLPTIVQPDDVHWEKPFVMLTDELSFSGGDAAPLLVKVNKLAPLFGQTTAGAGGNVESGYLTYSGLQFSLSRGLFGIYDPSGAYPENNFVEDHGVSPDVTYSHTLEDFRAGYVGYVAAFSDSLLGEVDRKHRH
jgi:Peptidase family S41